MLVSGRAVFHFVGPVGNFNRITSPSIHPRRCVPNRSACRRQTSKHFTHRLGTVPCIQGILGMDSDGLFWFTTKKTKQRDPKPPRNTIILSYLLRGMLGGLR